MSLLWSRKTTEAARARRRSELQTQRWGAKGEPQCRCAVVLNQTLPWGCRFSEAATSLNSLGVLAFPMDR